LRAWLNLRLSLPERVEAFAAGFRRHGYEVNVGVPMQPRDGDVLCTWNRINVGNDAALRFEALGLPVLVAENAAWGNDFAGERWLTVARNRHNAAGRFPVGGPERWDALGVGLAPWRAEGETVVLAQRGIGAAPTAMPSGWPADAHRRHGGRVRAHPGRHQAKPLAADLARCGRVVTWGSGAAVSALMWGIPVVSEMPGWIGAQDNTDAGRLAMFRQMAWAQWRVGEIESGEAVAWLLSSRA
jgi:hypothetical protein